MTKHNVEREERKSFQIFFRLINSLLLISHIVGHNFAIRTTHDSRLLNFSIQDEATTISRITDATTAATSYRARTTTTTTTVHSATNGKTSHPTTDHQSAERSVVIIEKSRNDILEQQLIEYEEFKQEARYKKFILTNSRFIAN